MAPRIGPLVLDLRFAGWILPYLFIAPYTKVEESFNMQAVHDLLSYGIWPPSSFPSATNGTTPGLNTTLTASAWIGAHYDHVSFPGAVPRSFVGAGVLAADASPLTALFATPPGGLALQTGVRATLGVWNALCLASYAHGVEATFGWFAAQVYFALQACQFHVMFYATRSLPNFLAFGPVVLALCDLLPLPPAAGAGGAGAASAAATATGTVRRLQRALVILTVMGIVMRSEIAVLLATHTVALLVQRRLNLLQVVQAGTVGLVVGLGLTVPIDSFFWQKTVWPELNAFIFNVIEGKSEEWGTSPFYYYLLNSLPKLLFNPVTLICIPIALATDASRRMWTLALPSLSYIAILSAQAHKEWRFIIYVLPPLTAVAGVGADQVMNKQKKGGFVRNAFFYLVLFSTLLSWAAGFAFTLISSLNYPGAAALNRFHILSRAADPAGVVNVHMDTLTCMSGVTRFLQLPTPDIRPTRPASAAPNAVDVVWKYNKEEEEQTLLRVEFWEQFQYVITESPERAIGAWEIVPESGTITGYSGFMLTKNHQELERQYNHADLAGDPTGDISDLSRSGLVWWNRFGLFLSKYTRGRWLTIRMEPKLYILRQTRGAL